MLIKYGVRTVLLCLMAGLLFWTQSAAGLCRERANPDALIEDLASAARVDREAASGADGSWLVKWQGAIPNAFLNESEVLSRQAGGVAVVRPKSGVSSVDWEARWSAAAGVAYMEPNRKVGISAKSNDPKLANQSYLAQIGAFNAWGSQTDNKSAVIAIVDTGVDLNHPDLGNNLISGINLLDRKQPPEDDNGHGTNVAGVIAAVGNNQLGTAGILWDARIMPIKALDSTGYGDEDKLGEGIRYAVDHGARIVVLSVGLYRYSKYLEDIALYAEAHNVLLVAATGNDAQELGTRTAIKYPAAYPTVLAVGGIGPNKQVEKQSNYGSEIDLVAPWTVYTTAVGGGYKYEEGTSMAAPQAAAAAALIWSKYPKMKASQVRNLLRQTAEDVSVKGWDKHTGYGLLRIDKALKEEPLEDIYENNNLQIFAKPLPAGSVAYAELKNGSDQDWFYIDAPFDGTVQLTVTADSTAASGVRVLHTQGKSTDSSYEHAANKPLKLKVNKGRSYIALQDSTLKGKSLKYRIQAGFSIYKDHYEDNDKQFKAYVLPVRNQTVVGTFDTTNDQDWFMLPIPEPGSLEVTLGVNNVRIDPALLVQRRGDEPTLIDSEGDGGPEFLQTTDVQPGNYYFRVSNVIADKAYPVAGEYSLTIRYVRRLIDPNEPNDRSFQATPLKMERVYYGFFDDSADQDWFQFTLEEASFIHLGVSSIPDDASMTLALFNQTQQPMKPADTWAARNELHYKAALPAGKYSFRLMSDRKFTGQRYELTAKSEILVAGFKDIADHWGRTAIAGLVKKKAIAASESYMFYPDRRLTRAEAVSMLVKAFGLKKSADIRFADLPDGHWAYDEVSKAYQAGIVQGYGNGTFRPNQLMSRREMAVMIGKALKLGAGTKGKSPFKDVAKNDPIAPLLRQLKAKGLVTGFQDGTFRPQAKVSRAEFASLLFKSVNKKS